jgi:IMP dehydrogenase
MKLYTFDDVLIKPKFSTITSRKEVDISTTLAGEKLALPILSANMATVTGPEMCRALIRHGAMPVMHRFQGVDELITPFATSHGARIWWSFGVNDLERVSVLYKLGARKFCLDVAHGAQMQIAIAALEARTQFPDIKLMIGNFATSESIQEFHHYSEGAANVYKVGIGPGSMCTTRIKTGCGIPQLSAIIDCVSTGHEIIADGGLKTPGDIAKALGAGASAVMVGSMFAGTLESPGEIIDGKKVFHGSAFKDSPDKKHRTSEGEKTLVPIKGSVEAILDDIEGGLRSSFCYVGAKNLAEFYSKCEFVEISGNTRLENGAHGK